MIEKETTTVLVVDDDEKLLDLYEELLTSHGFRVVRAQNGKQALELVKSDLPDVILLDVIMPGFDGFEVCSRLQQDPRTAYIPVIFVTASRKHQDKARAFAVGAVDYLVKPFEERTLIEKIRFYCDTGIWWNELRPQKEKLPLSIVTDDFTRFRDYLIARIGPDPEKVQLIEKMTAAQLYPMARKLGLSDSELVQMISQFVGIPYIERIDPAEIELGRLPVSFCRANQVIPVKRNETDGLLISNPFDINIIDLIERLEKDGRKVSLFLIEPDKIVNLLGRRKITTSPVGEAGSDQSILSVANKVLYAAVRERASDIHIVTRKTDAIVRFRIDGDMRTYFSLKKEVGIKLINRFKVLGDMDIAEKRKPQDGTFEAVMGEKNFRLRLASTRTPEGEYLVIRILEPYAKPRGLSELGMSGDQVEMMLDLINRTHGLILVVGPTGSGKTTTVYSLLSQIDCQSRNLVTVEDPVEYRIPFANQQQVDEKAGITFEILLKSVVRQDPDIIFMGEIRDQYSARMAMDFASTGHLTLTTLHTSNATTAVFRLERLGINRCVMAEAILCIVAQRLVKKLCPRCKKWRCVTDREREILAQFTPSPPDEVAVPVGCLECGHTGYRGREGIYEILRFDTRTAEMIRSGRPISEIRNHFRNSGVYLISNHAVEKVKKGIFAPMDVYRAVLAEEIELLQKPVR